jgi:hypothetical protein
MQTGSPFAVLHAATSLHNTERTASAEQHTPVAAAAESYSLDFCQGQLSQAFLGVHARLMPSVFDDVAAGDASTAENLTTTTNNNNTDNHNHNNNNNSSSSINVNSNPNNSSSSSSSNNNAKLGLGVLHSLRKSPFASEDPAAHAASGGGSMHMSNPAMPDAAGGLSTSRTSPVDTPRSGAQISEPIQSSPQGSQRLSGRDTSQEGLRRLLSGETGVFVREGSQSRALPIPMCAPPIALIPLCLYIFRHHDKATPS